MQKVYLTWIASGSIRLAPVRTHLSDLIAELELAEEESMMPKLCFGKARALNKTQFLNFSQSNELHYLGCWGRYRVYAQVRDIWPRMTSELMEIHCSQDVTFVRKHNKIRVNSQRKK